MSRAEDRPALDLGYRAYDGPRRRPAAAMLTVAVFTAKRMLGIGRGGRHKVLPVVTLAIAFVPALISLAFAALADTVASDDLISYGDYGFFTGSALVLFAALLAPEALCTIPLGLARPLPGGAARPHALSRRKWAAVFAVMLLITVGPLLFVLVSFLVGGYGPSIEKRRSCCSKSSGPASSSRSCTRRCRWQCRALPSGERLRPSPRCS